MCGERRDSQLALSAAQSQRARRVGITGDVLLNYSRIMGSGDTRQETGEQQEIKTVELQSPLKTEQQILSLQRGNPGNCLEACALCNILLFL